MVNHLLPEPGVGRRWEISTTEPSGFRPPHFTPAAIAEIHTAAASQKGRALFCYDSTLVSCVAAVSFHIDPSLTVPIILRWMALRADWIDDPNLRPWTYIGAGILKHFLHTIGQLDNRRGTVETRVSVRASHVAAMIGELEFAVSGRPGIELRLTQEPLI